MTRRSRGFATPGLVLMLLFTCSFSVRAQDARETENVFLLTLDGLRWQELFTGADSALIRDERYTEDPESMTARFWKDRPSERREALMPFFWNVIAEEGQLYGNHALGCTVSLTNGMRFSYPGYNEILTGAADDERIDSNDKVPNPNVTILEVANQQEGFEGKVAAFTSWDVFPYIINEERSGVPVNGGFEEAAGPDLTPKEAFLNELQARIPSPWSTVRLDAFTQGYALEYLNTHHPRLLYVAYGETDDFAHDGDFSAYLASAHRTDAFIRELWDFAQSDPQYRGKTTLVITTDHGRGLGDAWTGHGSDVDRTDEIWIAVLGPDTPAIGVVETCELYQNQVAPTVAHLLGLDFQGTASTGSVIKEASGQ